MKRTGTLIDLGEFTQGLSYSRYKSTAEGAHLYRVLQVTDIDAGRITPTTADTAREALDLDSVPNAVATPGQVVMALRGTAFKAALIPDGLDDTIVGNNLVALTVAKGVLPEFALLLLTSAPMHDQVATLATGTTLPQIPLSKFKTIAIDLPQEDEQRALVEASQALRAQRQRFGELMSLRELRLASHLQHFIPTAGA